MRISDWLSRRRVALPPGHGRHEAGPGPTASRHGVLLPRATAGWCFGVAAVGGGLGVLGGLLVTALGDSWPVGVVMVVASLVGALWLVVAGVFLRWLAALYQAVTGADGYR